MDRVEKPGAALAIMPSLETCATSIADWSRAGKMQKGAVAATAPIPGGFARYQAFAKRFSAAPGDAAPLVKYNTKNICIIRERQGLCRRTPRIRQPLGGARKLPLRRSVGIRNLVGEGG